MVAFLCFESKFNMQALIGQKKSQGQRFLEDGMRIPVTLIDIKGNIVISHKTAEKDKYQAVQLGFGIKKNSNKAEIGHVVGAKLSSAPKFLKEVRIYDESETLPEVGSEVNPQDVFSPGDLIDVSGFSKGKGYAGGVKRYGFHGGPKTHGQSDRHRAPGAIGSGTTPGRVYRGKKMAGNMGNDNVTIRNLEVVDITADGVLIVKGLIPGVINGLIYVKKVGQDKKYVPLWREKTEENLGETSEGVRAEAVDEPTTEEAPKEEAKAESLQQPQDEQIATASEQATQEKTLESKEKNSSDEKQEVVENAK